MDVLLCGCSRPAPLVLQKPEIFWTLSKHQLTSVYNPRWSPITTDMGMKIISYSRKNGEDGSDHLLIRDRPSPGKWSSHGAPRPLLTEGMSPAKSAVAPLGPAFLYREPLGRGTRKPRPVSGGPIMSNRLSPGNPLSAKMGEGAAPSKPAPNIPAAPGGTTLLSSATRRGAARRPAPNPDAG